MFSWKKISSSSLKLEGGEEGGGEEIQVGEVNGGAVDGLRLTSNAQRNSQNNIPFYISFFFVFLFFSFLFFSFFFPSPSRPFPFLPFYYGGLTSSFGEEVEEYHRLDRPILPRSNPSVIQQQVCMAIVLVWPTPTAKFKISKSRGKGARIEMASVIVTPHTGRVENRT